MTSGLRLGVVLWAQGSTWPDLRQAARLVDSLGYDRLWAWDHLEPVFGCPLHPIPEGPSRLAAMAGVTSHVRLGLFVAGDTLRNPALLARSTVTLDHLPMVGPSVASAAWLEREHRSARVEFGSGFGERLRWLDESVPALRAGVVR
jgi:hypothetical protein